MTISENLVKTQKGPFQSVLGVDHIPQTLVKINNTQSNVCFILFSDRMLSVHHSNNSSLNSTYQPFEADFSHVQLSQNENGRMFSDIFSSNNNFGESIKNPFAPLTNSEDNNNLGPKEGRKQRKRKNRQVQ